ncbi:MAG: hypothetical protein ACE5JP_17670 [Candidatus Bipolaricaulia bacterium]
MTIRKLYMCALLMGAFLMFVSAPYLNQVHAQTDLETPESVADAYFIALRENNWNGVCQLMHPEAIDSLRNVMLPIALEADRVGAEAEEEFLEVLVGGIGSIEEFLRLNLQQFCVSFFQGPILTGLLEGISNSEIMALGHVNEGPEVAHVVYRMNTRFDDFGEGVDDDMNITVTQLSVISLQRYGSEWRVLLTGELEGMVQVLQMLQKSVLEEQ